MSNLGENIIIGELTMILVFLWNIMSRMKP